MEHETVEGQQYTYQTNRAGSVEADNPVNPSADNLVATMNGNTERIQPRIIRYESKDYVILILNIKSRLNYLTHFLRI